MAISKSLRFEIFKRDKFTCQYCGRSTPSVVLEVDHIHPVSDGGDDDYDNLVTSCFDCNRGKGKRPLGKTLPKIDVVDETAKLIEREEQLQAYNAIRLQIKEREDDELDELADLFTGQFSGRQSEYAERSFPREFIRSALKKLSYLDIMEWIPYAVKRTEDSDTGDYHTVAAAKYLSGIIKNKLKEASGGPS